MGVFAEADAQEVLISKVKEPIKRILGGGVKGIWGLFSILYELWLVYQVIRNKLPEPAKDNVDHPNSPILIDIRDRFFKFEDNPPYQRIFRALWNLLIIHYDHSGYYRYRFDWVKEELEKRKDWQPRPPNEPRPFFWREFWKSDTVKEDILSGKRLKDIRAKMTDTVIEAGEYCPYCGGDIDRRTKIDDQLPIWVGKCFRCGEDITVIEGS